MVEQSPRLGSDLSSSTSSDRAARLQIACNSSEPQFPHRWHVGDTIYLICENWIVWGLNELVCDSDLGQCLAYTEQFLWLSLLLYVRLSQWLGQKISS